MHVSVRVHECESVDTWSYTCVCITSLVSTGSRRKGGVLFVLVMGMVKVLPILGRMW